jgi:hypothetical protein
MIKERIKDIVKISKVKDANIESLLEVSYRRGFIDGKDFAKAKAIYAIKHEH